MYAGANPRVTKRLKLTSLEEDMCAVVNEVNMVDDNPREWWYDTGATTHICTDKSMFTTYRKSKSEEQLFMGNTAYSKIEGRGKVVPKLTSERELSLNNVKHVPDMRKNLVSGTLLSKAGFGVNFEADKLVLRKNGMYLGKGYAKGGLVKLCVSTVLRTEKINNANVVIADNSSNNNSVAYLVESFNIWHERLGHVNYKSMQRLMNLNLIPKCKINKDKCEVCVHAKLTKTPSPQVQRTTEPLGLIHTDLCDLKFIQTRGGKKYFVTFIDDHTKYCYVYLLRSKDEALSKFQEYKLEVENQLGKTIKIVRSDRGGEYDGPFNDFCQQHGIIHQTTTPYSPESNGVAERKNRTPKEMMNAMLQESGLPQSMWGEALLTTNYILNKIPHKVTGKTPYELWKGVVPSYKYPKVWGCLAKVAIPPPKKVTIGPKTVDCIFIGYAHNSSAYRFLVHKSDIPDIHVNTVMESRNVSFFENIFPCKDKQRPKRTFEQRETSSSTNEASTSRTSTLEVEDVVDEPRRSKRARKEKSFGDDFMMVFLTENEPRTYSEAMSIPDAPYWKEAVNSEIDSILQHHTYEITDLLEGFKALGCKWIFTTKMKPDGSVDKYKARLVVQGFRQKEGLDFFDTYSPVTRITSIRILVGIAALRGLEIHQMDVKTAFLHGDLEEEIYMKQL
ncbi:Retrovirus-related Pol polyprotein from transposon TNT 1-94 [Cardamine amara subsp. amara]|uniref:Retrovirus-related Pol polyprotein from transposon TNT 1-94 n=1 Tax=Cardamine amara subsp. amara TaxID=228776 RepID=A0ABD1B552_CARAN